MSLASKYALWHPEPYDQRVRLVCRAWLKRSGNEPALSQASRIYDLLYVQNVVTQTNVGGGHGGTTDFNENKGRGLLNG